MKTVIFACVHHAGRSRMAAAFFRGMADPRRARALSAGTRPASEVRPDVVAVMGEAGIDLAGAHPRRLTPELVRDADLLEREGWGRVEPRGQDG